MLHQMPAGQAELARHSLPVHSPQVLPIQQVSHDVTGDALGSISHVKTVVLGHVISHMLGELKHHWHTLQAAAKKKHPV